MPTLWRDALAPSVSWQSRAAFVETRVRVVLASLAVGEVLSTAELVERLFPVADVQSPEDTGARAELYTRVGKLGQNTPLAIKSPSVAERGYNKGRTINRLLWRRLDNVATAPAAMAPDIGDEIQAIRDRLRIVEAGLSALGQAIAAFQASVTAKE